MRTLRSALLLGCSVALVSLAARAQATPPPPHAKTTHVRHVLVVGQTKGFEHDSVSAAMAAVYNMGEESGLWDTT
ncbi:MAG TPA: hypothetical protein VJV22_14960, partial [Acidobacteriaceae bacterium]|nr:hypothetical protein [Acidobacteriaceae bacterium]